VTFALQGKGGRTIAAVIFEVRGEKILWVKSELDTPNGELAFESPITTVPDYPYYARIEI